MNRFLRGLALIALGTAPAWGQNAKQEERILEKQAKQQARKEAKQKAKQQDKTIRTTDPALERFLRMSPEQQEQALAQLPPARRQQVEQRLKQFQQLPPDLQNQLRGRYEQFLSLPQPRKQALRDELQTLHKLPPAARTLRLNSSELRMRFSPEELDILREVSGGY